MSSLGRYRVVASAKAGKVLYLVKTGNITVSKHSSRGIAINQMSKFHDAEKKTRRALKETREAVERSAVASVALSKAGFKTGKVAVKRGKKVAKFFGAVLNELTKDDTPKRRKKKKSKKRRKR